MIILLGSPGDDQPGFPIIQWWFPKMIRRSNFRSWLVQQLSFSPCNWVGNRYWEMIWHVETFIYIYIYTHIIYKYNVARWFGNYSAKYLTNTGMRKKREDWQPGLNQQKHKRIESTKHVFLRKKHWDLTGIGDLTSKHIPNGIVLQ